MGTATNINPNEVTEYFKGNRTLYDKFLRSLENYARHRFQFENGCDMPDSFEITCNVRVVCKMCGKTSNKCKCEKE
jgi:hypothetical protein